MTFSQCTSFLHGIFGSNFVLVDDILRKCISDENKPVPGYVEVSPSYDYTPFLPVYLMALQHYLPLDDMIIIPIYVVWGCWVQLNPTQFYFADHITFNNGYMKHAHTRQKMTNNSNNKKRKQV